MKWLLFIQAASTLLTSDSVSIITKDESSWWEIQKTSDSLFDAVRNDYLHVRKINLDDNAIHTCYEYEHRKLHRAKSSLVGVNRTRTFCYPAVVITGVRKCSTSAFYGLLGALPGSVKMVYKENCPYIGDRSIVEYFDSLPEFVSLGSLVIDGCVDLKGNMKVCFFVYWGPIILVFWGQCQKHVLRLNMAACRCETSCDIQRHFIWLVLITF